MPYADVGSCTCSALAEERNRAAEQRRAAESAAYERSRELLEEEIGKDRAWRRAVEGVRFVRNVFRLSWPGSGPCRAVVTEV